MAPRGLTWFCGVVWCGVVWCGVVWCGVVWCGVVWCGVVWCGVVWCGVVWCGVVWCGVVWCGVVWCGVVWCGVVCRRQCHQMATARRPCIRVMQNGRAVSERMLHVVCCAPVTGRELSPRAAVLVRGRPWDSLPLHLLVQLKFSQSDCLCANKRHVANGIASKTLLRSIGEHGTTDCVVANVGCRQHHDPV